MVTRKMVPSGALNDRSMAGVAVMPIIGAICRVVHWPLSTSATGTAVSPFDSSDCFQSCEPVSASKAYSESFSGATYSTLRTVPETEIALTYKGWASTAPSVASGPENNKPKLVEFTFDGDRRVSCRFCPERELSLCDVSTLTCAQRTGTKNTPARHRNPAVVKSFFG